MMKNDKVGTEKIGNSRLFERRINPGLRRAVFLVAALMALAGFPSWRQRKQPFDYEQGSKNVEAAYRNKMQTLTRTGMPRPRKRGDGRKVRELLTGDDKPEKARAAFSSRYSRRATRRRPTKSTRSREFRGSPHRRQDLRQEPQAGGIPPSRRWSLAFRGRELVGEGGRFALSSGELGYGCEHSSRLGILPGSMFVFDVEIVEVIKG
jgi:hypothetical protein